MADQKSEIPVRCSEVYIPGVGKVITPQDSLSTPPTPPRWIRANTDSDKPTAGEFIYKLGSL